MKREMIFDVYVKEEQYGGIYHGDDPHIRIKLNFEEKFNLYKSAYSTFFVR